jgi:hypothetical protein
MAETDYTSTIRHDIRPIRKAKAMFSDMESNSPTHPEVVKWSHISAIRQSKRW